jgi:hypothetical protein
MPTQSPTTTDAATATAAATDPPRTTTLPTSTPPTTAPPTTLDPAALEQQIRADFERTWAGYNECVYEPTSCQFASVNVPGGALDNALRQTVDELVINNLRAGRGSGPIGHRVEEVVVVSSTESDLWVCLTDGAVLFDIQDPSNPDDDIVMNDAVNSYRNLYRMHLVGGRWLRDSGEQIQVFAGVSECGG